MRVVVLVLVLLVVKATGEVMDDGAPSATARSVLFDLDEPSLRGRWTRGVLASADMSGDGRADLVLASRHVGGEFGTGPASVTLWILERRGEGFAVAYRNTWPGGAGDLAVGDPDGDGQNEVVLIVSEYEPQAKRVETPLHVIGRSSARSEGGSVTYCQEWSGAVWTVEGHIPPASLTCVHLLDQTLIAVGAKHEVRFFRWTGSTYAEAADKRIDLRQLVPEGQDHDGWPGFIRFGPGIGLVTGLASLGASAEGPRLALAACDVVSDTGGGAVVVLKWQHGWKLEALLPTSQKPKNLVVGDLVPGGSPELIVATDNDMYLTEGLILYEERDQQWVERWRRGPTGEGKPNLDVGGLDFANGGRTFALAANTHLAEEFQSASVDLYQWQGHKGVVGQAQIPCESRLLGLATYPGWKPGEDAIVVIEEGGIGRLIPVPAAAVEASHE